MEKLEKNHSDIKTKAGNPISQNTLIATIPFLGTYVAYVYERGYLSYYKISTNLMQIDIIRIIESTATVIVFLLITTALLVGAKSISNGKGAIRKALFTPIFYVIFIGVFAYFSQPIKTFIITISILLAAFIIIRFTSPLIGRKKGTTYSQQLVNELNNEEEYTKNTKTNALTYLSLLFFSTLIVAGLGLKHAKDKEFYYILKGQENTVLIEIYGDTAILKKYDPITKQMPDEFSVIKLSETASLELSRKKIGPLLSKKS